MKRKQYRGHPRALIDAWFAPDEDLGRYDPALYFFDPLAAEKVLDFFRLYCTHVEGEWAGKPLEPEQWQHRILRDLFGWKLVANGMRKYRTAYIEVPRKNGKSTLGAGVALYLTTADGEPGAKIFSAATEKDQAGIIFDIASAMARQSPVLARRIELFKRSMYFKSSGAVYRVLSGAPRKSGLNAHGIIFDELHEQPNRKLWDILHTSTVARRQPITWATTTAGVGDDLESICWEIHSHALKVRDGIFDDPTLLAIIFGADEKKDEYTDEKVWAKVNPNLGVSVKLDYLRAESQKAQNVPAYQNTFKRLHLNIWTRQMELWMPKDLWDKCGERFPLKPLAGKPCYGGISLSSGGDLASFARGGAVR